MLQKQGQNEQNKLENTIDKIKELEMLLYSLLDNHRDEIENIINDIKKSFLSKVENIENKFYITFFICEVIKTYFSDLLSNDFLKLEIEDLRSEKLN